MRTLTKLSSGESKQTVQEKRLVAIVLSTGRIDSSPRKEVPVASERPKYFHNSCDSIQGLGNAPDGPEKMPPLFRGDRSS